jgi:hypothetical protein
MASRSNVSGGGRFAARATVQIRLAPRLGAGARLEDPKA